MCRLTRVLNFWVRRFNDLGPIIKGCLGGASNTFCTKISSSSSSRLSPQGRSGRLDTALHCLLSPTLLRSTTLPSSRTQSIHRFFGRLLFLVPVSLRSADHLTNSSSSFLFTCPYHLSLLSLIFSFNFATFTSCLMSLM